MKKVILLGDSIRMGYDKYVRESLADSAEVYYPTENCKFSQYMLRMIPGWITDFPEEVDLIHWNAGLWDLLEIYGDEPLTPIEFYAQMIKRIDRRLRYFYPNAKIIFATTTYVDESGNTPDHIRHNSTITAYNKAALEALKGTDTIINDLSAVSKDAPDIWRSDRTHYRTPLGIENIGGAVVSTICKELDITAKKLDMHEFCPELYTKENIGS